MIIFADESVESLVVAELRTAGHHVDHATDSMAGADDDRILQTANAIGGTLLTADKDFGELVFRDGKVHGGVILVRLGGLSSPTKAKITVEAIAKHGKEMSGAFSVISPGLIRIRR